MSSTAGVEVVFLNRELGRSRRTTCSSRSRAWSPSTSGPRSWSEPPWQTARRRRRIVNVLSGAYGYRYISKDEGGGAARYEIVLEEARVVRQIFQWVGQERPRSVRSSAGS